MYYHKEAALPLSNLLDGKGYKNIYYAQIEIEELKTIGLSIDVLYNIKENNYKVQLFKDIEIIKTYYTNTEMGVNDIISYIVDYNGCKYPFTSADLLRYVTNLGCTFIIDEQNIDYYICYSPDPKQFVELKFPTDSFRKKEPISVWVHNIDRLMNDLQVLCQVPHKMIIDDILRFNKDK